MKIFLSILFVYLLLYCVGCKSPNPRGIAGSDRSEIKDILDQAIYDKSQAEKSLVIDQELKQEIKKAEAELEEK